MASVSIVYLTLFLYLTATSSWTESIGKVTTWHTSTALDKTQHMHPQGTLLGQDNTKHQTISSQNKENVCSYGTRFSCFWPSGTILAGEPLRDNRTTLLVGKNVTIATILCSCGFVCYKPQAQIRALKFRA